MSRLPYSVQLFGKLTRYWAGLFAIGVLYLIGGSIGLFASVAYTVGTVLAVGALLLAGAALKLYSAVFHGAGWKSRGIAVLIALMYAAAGILMVLQPLFSAEWLTLMMGGLLVAVGFMRAIAGTQHRPEPGWGWVVAGGALSILFGLYILVTWPLSGLWLIGLAVSFELIFDGWSAVFIALAARRVHDAIERAEKQTDSQPQAKTDDSVPAAGGKVDGGTASGA